MPQLQSLKLKVMVLISLVSLVSLNRSDCSINLLHQRLVSMNSISSWFKLATQLSDLTSLLEETTAHLRLLLATEPNTQLTSYHAKVEPDIQITSIYRKWKRLLALWPSNLLSLMYHSVVAKVASKSTLVSFQKLSLSVLPESTLWSWLRKVSSVLL